MTVDSPADIEGLQLAGSLVREVFERMKAAARPGVTTRELDTIGADLLRRAGARSAPQKFYDFPGATCISVNEHAAHGIPDDRRLADGDLVNIDVSAELGGYVADMGESFVVGRARRSRQRICDAVARAVREALKEVRPGRPLNVIGAAVQKIADRHDYRIIENLGSHGVGRNIHEEPSYIPRDNPLERRRLTAGLVLTIEPFFTTGAPHVRQLADGWTLAVEPGDLVAQFEHTVIVTADGPIVVTA